MTIINISPGIYPNVPFEEYLAWDAVSSSFLKDMDHTPHLARWRKDNPEDEKDCYRKGRLFHCLALEPDKADIFFIGKPAEYHHEKDAPSVMREWNGNANVCKEWEAVQYHAGRTVVSAATMTEAAGMAAQVRAMPAIKDFLPDAQMELSIVWIDRLTGLLCKARFDGYKNWTVIDLKHTSGSASRERFPREAAIHRYPLQAAHYMEAIKTIAQPIGADGKPIEIPTFTFIAIEGYAPFDLLAHDVEDHPEAASWPFLRYGRLKRAALMAQIKHCIKNNEWPGYGDEHADMTLTYEAAKDLELLEQLSGGI